MIVEQTSESTWIVQYMGKTFDVIAYYDGGFKARGFEPICSSIEDLAITCAAYWWS